jgi:hypothetical protein
MGTFIGSDSLFLFTRFLILKRRIVRVLGGIFFKKRAPR